MPLTSIGQGPISLPLHPWLLWASPMIQTQVLEPKPTAADPNIALEVLQFTASGHNLQMSTVQIIDGTLGRCLVSHKVCILVASP